MSLSTEEPFIDILVREAPAPGVRYRTGRLVYDEALVQGRYIGRYWNSAGWIEPETNAQRYVREQASLALEAFGLEVDGQGLQAGWSWQTAAQGDGARPGTRQVRVELASRVRPIRVRVCTRLDGTPVLVRWLEITNTGSVPAALAAVWPWSGRVWPTSCTHGLETADALHGYRVGRFADNVWGTEGDFLWETLPDATLRLESRRGRSGHSHPFCVVANPATGEHLFVQLAWSGNWAIEVTCDRSLGGPRFLLGRAGPAGPAPLRIIAPGETIVTPEVHVGLLHGDLDDMVQAVHAHQRRSVFPPQPAGRAQPIILNHWGYITHEMSESQLRAEIDMAVEIGAECFIVDAGWFGDPGSNWWDTVGDWVTRGRLPNGLEPVFGYARSRGLLYGLWMDAERIGPRSQVAQEHPEWLLQRDGQPVGTALDLTRPEAAQWLEAQINRLVQQYDLDLFRLDYNIDVGEGGQVDRAGFWENTLWRHYEVLYGIFDRLRARFPKLLLENCSSGGGRTDLGLVSRFHTTWVSDWMTPPRTAKILNGMTLVLAPEYVNRMTGVVMDGHARGDLDFCLRVPLFGHWSISGVAPTVPELSPAVKARIVHAIELYKEFVRPMLSTCRVFHHTPVIAGREPSGWGVLEYVSSDRSRAMVGLFRLAGPAEAEYRLRLRGVEMGRRYRVTFDNTGQSAVVDGWTLGQDGVVVRLDRAMTSELLLLEAWQ